MLPDIVLVTVLVHTEVVEVRVWVLPRALRKPVVCLGGDGDGPVLDATRLILALRGMVHQIMGQPYARIKRLERSMSSCYYALPPTPPVCRMNQCEIYSSIAISYVQDLFGTLFSRAEVILLLWTYTNHHIPDTCPQCHVLDTWVFRDEKTITCCSCEYTIN